MPLVNLINGGKHASNDLDFQEFIVIPVGADSILEALQISTEVNLALAEILLERYGKSALNTGDEGGYAPAISSPQRGARPAARGGRRRRPRGPLPLRARLRRDPLLRPRRRHLPELAGETRDTDAMIELYLELIREFDVITIEDPLDEEDFEGFARLTAESGIQIVGDDLFVTNPERLRTGIESGAANALLWKVNQIGTLSEALDAADLAHRSAYTVVVSERSGETEDPIIADLAVALGAGQIKTGAPVRGERTAKYNRLIRIAEELGSTAVYPGERSPHPRSPPEAEPWPPPIQLPTAAAAPSRRAAIEVLEALASRGEAARAPPCASPPPGSPPATRRRHGRRGRARRRRADRRRRAATRSIRAAGCSCSAPARRRWRSRPRSSGSSATGSTAARSSSATASRRALERIERARRPTTRCPSERSVAAARRLLERRGGRRRARPRDRLLHRRQLGARQPAAGRASRRPRSATCTSSCSSSGMAIVEVNTVRKHVSGVQGRPARGRRSRRRG